MSPGARVVADGAPRLADGAVAVLLDDPELTRRRPGEEFARAYVREGSAATVRLRCSLSDLFPLATRRPRYTLRHLLRSATVDDDRDEVVVFEERADDASPAEALPEFGFRVGTSVVPLHTISAAVAVPGAVLDDPAALAAFVDLRLLVRLGTVENDALVNGDGASTVRGLLGTPGVRRQAAGRTVAATIAAAASSCEWHGGSFDGLVLHPTDWWGLLAEGSLLERLGAAGVRVSRTRVVPPGKAIAGDFSAGATVLDRRTSVVRLAKDGEATGVRQEGPVLVASIVEGLAVHLPGHFVVAELPEADAEGDRG